jgi:hypothetical protein
MKLTRILPTLASLALATTSSHGAIALLNTLNFTDTGAYADSKTYTLAFDPNNNADTKLVDLEATIPDTEALNGKLFGRLIGASP